LQGRMNATMRSVNRGMIVLGAPLGGVLADSAGSRFALWVAVAGLTGQAIAISCSQLRHARLPDLG
jgi:predicted MFS family arabinose efflux permease